MSAGDTPDDIDFGLGGQQAQTQQAGSQHPDASQHQATNDDPGNTASFPTPPLRLVVLTVIYVIPLWATTGPPGLGLGLLVLAFGYVWPLFGYGLIVLALVIGGVFINDVYG